MDNFSYDAPDYFLDFSKDLVSEDIKKAEAFFETEHKNHFGTQINDSGKEQNFYTPMKEPPKPDDSERCMRRSLSMVNLATNNIQVDKPVDDTISDAMKNLQVTEEKSKSTEPLRKANIKPIKGVVSTLDLRSRSISRDHLDKLAKPKRKNISHEDLQAKKYVSMAEAVRQFQQKTPVRFHSKPKIGSNPIVKGCGIKPTIPQSPSLATKQRARPIHVMSREQQEWQEYEEAKKFKIKANPVNPRILNGPVQLKAAMKKPTQPEPFKLTEVPIRKAPTLPQQPLFEFHAKPVPKSVLEPPKPIIKSSLWTQAHTPKMMKRYARVEPAKNETIIEPGQVKPFKGLPTKLQPFSFEQRDKDIVKKREQLVNEVLEEEKKAREFHAKPIPKNIFKSPQAKNNTIYYQKRQKSDCSVYKSAEDMSQELNSVSTFKARPAKVLQMKPFEPKKDDDHVIEIAEFQLSTEYRAKQREEYAQKKKEKEEKIAQLIKQREEENLRQELEEMARIRKEAEYKAQPVRRYKEVKAVTAKKVTDPMSPNFTYDKIKKQHLNINKENSINNSNTNAL